MSDFSLRFADHGAITEDQAVVSFVEGPAEWDALMYLAPVPHLTQSFAYGEGKRSAGWQVRRALFSLLGRPVAFATVLERRILGIRVASRVNRGPVFLDLAPDAAVERAVHAALRRQWRGPLLIAPALELGERSDAVLRAAGYIRRQRHGWCSGRIDLRLDEGTLLSGFSSSFRNRLRNAEKAGAELRIANDAASYDWLLERHLENMRAKNFKGPAPEMLQAMRDARPEAVTVLQLISEGVAVAGMSVVRFGTHAEYHVGWFGAAGRKLNAGNFLMWNAMLEMKRRGASVFDLGGLRPGDGYTQFKRTMKPCEYELAGEWIVF